MYSFVYITHTDQKSAVKLAQTLVKEKLLACANVIPRMISVYAWKGKIEESSETLLIGKTKTKLIKKLQKRVEQLHPYQCPCILSFKIDEGNAAYLKWLGGNL